MRIITPILLLTFFVVSCNLKHADNKSIPTSLVKKSIEPLFSIKDSLIKYHESDSLFTNSEKTFYVGKANNKDFGVAEITDTTFVFFQKEENNWKATDTLKTDALFGVDIQDLNEDNKQDIIVTVNITGAGGNYENRVFIYNSLTEEFRHNKYFDLPNIQYDKKKNLVEFAWWAGVVHCQEKYTYKVSGDSLMFNEGVDICPDEKTEGEIVTIEFYKMNGKERVVTKAITGKASKLWKIFDRTFWDTTELPDY